MLNARHKWRRLSRVLGHDSELKIGYITNQ